MSVFLSDLRNGLRLLSGNPWFTLAAVVTLALGIGASTAIFSSVNAVLLRPLPFKEPESLVVLWESNLQQDMERNPVSPPNFIDWREQNQVFEETAAYISWSPTMITREGGERLPSARVSSNLFKLLGVNPIVGRYFGPADTRSADDNTVVISYNLWQRRFAANRDVINQSLILNGESYSVIGVMPPNFQFPLGIEHRELWAPLVFDADDLSSRSTRYLQVMARLRPTVSIEQARREMRSVAKRIEQQYPQTNEGWSVMLLPLYDELVGDTRPALLVMFAAVGFVLLIGCANVANLLLARAADRHRDMAVRIALGASRSRIVRQVLTEGLVLAAIGGGLGVLLAIAGVKLIVASAPSSIPRLNEVSLDARVLAFSAAISLLSILLFGLAPALLASKPNLSRILKEGSMSVAGGTGGLRFRRALVITEIALALVLLVGAGLMIKAFDNLMGVSSGFSVENVLTAQVTLPSYKYQSPQQHKVFFQRLVEAVRSLPGVQAAGVISYLPLSGGNFEWIFSIEGRAPTQPNEKLFAEYRQVSADYFEAMDISLLRGRTLSDGDVAGAVPVVVINDAFARRYFPNEDPLHKRIGFGREPEWREIVGIVADVRHFGLEVEPKAEAYVSYLQDPWPSMALVVRSALDPNTLVGEVRRELKGIDKDQPLYNVRTMESLVAESVAPKRLAVLLLGIFSGISLMLAVVGVFGIMADSVSQRTHEIGIRVALGAQPGTIKRLIVSQAAAMALVGIILGTVMAIGLTRAMASFLFNVSATDPLVFASVAITLGFVLLLASYIPARRAISVDPITALRYGADRPS